MNTRTFITMLALTLAGLASGVTAQEISDEELRSHAWELREAVNNSRIVFRSRYHTPLAGRTLPPFVLGGPNVRKLPDDVPHEPPADLKPFQAAMTLHDVAISGGKFRTEQVIQIGPSDLVDQRRVRTWDGIQARGKSFDPDGHGQSMHIGIEPDQHVSAENYWTWLGEGLFQSGFDMLTLTKLLETVPPKSHRVENGITTLTFEVPGWEGFEIDIAATRDPRLRILSMTRRTYRPDPDQAARPILSGEIRVEFERNEPGDELPLPRRARMTITHYDNDEAVEMWAVETFELESIEPLEELPEDFFRLSDEHEAGLLVTDDRFGITYKVGGQELNMEGRILQTDTPLEGNVGENLAEIVERGTYVDPESGARASRPSGPPAALWWIAWSLMGAGFIGLVMVIITRARR